MFEKLRAAIEAALEAATPPSDSSDLARGMRAAMVEARVSIDKMRDGIGDVEARLERERQDRADAERRGRLAADIGDTETVRIAEEYAARHGEKIAVLDRRLEAQRADLALAERELHEMKEQFRRLGAGHLGPETRRSAEEAWRHIETAGGARPETDVADELLKSELDRSARSEAAEQQLRDLKKKMGK